MYQKDMVSQTAKERLCFCPISTKQTWFLPVELVKILPPMDCQTILLLLMTIKSNDSQSLSKCSEYGFV